MSLSCIDQGTQSTRVIHSTTHCQSLYFITYFLNKHIKYFILNQKTICTDACLKIGKTNLNNNFNQKIYSIGIGYHKQNHTNHLKNINSLNFHKHWYTILCFCLFYHATNANVTQVRMKMSRMIWIEKYFMWNWIQLTLRT